MEKSNYNLIVVIVNEGFSSSPWHPCISVGAGAMQ